MFTKKTKKLFSKTLVWLMVLQFFWQLNFSQLKAAWSDVYTKLLIQSDTTNWSTTFTDSSSNEHDITVNGNVRHSTSQSKFGSSAIYFDGDSDYLTIPNSQDWQFGSDDFTIDFWAYPTSNANDNGRAKRFMSTHNGAYSDLNWYWLFSSQLNWTSYNGTCVVTGGNFADYLNKWSHFALAREWNTLRFFADGYQIASDTTCYDNFQTTNPLRIGTAGRELGAGDFQGYFDEVRVTKGLARWTGNFTPPSSPYADTPRQPTISLSNDEMNNQVGVEIKDNGDEWAFYPDAAIELDETGLVGHWKMDGDFMDSSWKWNHGTANGGLTANADGQRRQAGGFDGINDYVSIPNSSDFDFGTGDFTVNFWMNVNSEAALIAQAELISWPANWVIRKIATTKNSLGLYYNYSPPNGYFGWPVSFEINQWYNIVMKREGGLIKAFVNGEELPGSVTWNGNFNTETNDPVLFGNPYDYTAPTRYPRYFSGGIDEVKMYKRALSNKEIKENYKKDSLVGYWKFDDVGTSVTVDYSGNGNNGTLTNMSGALSYHDGQVGKALEFDGVDEYVTINSTEFTTSESHTFSVWQKTLGGNWNAFTGNNLSSGGYWMWHGAGNALALYLQSPTPLYFNANLDDVGIDEWFNLTVVTESVDSTHSNFYIYLNGELTDTKQNVEIPTASFTYPSIGNGGNSNRYFNGSLDEFAIYSRALSGLEVRQTYEATAPKFKIEQKETSESEYQIPEKIEQQLIAETINDVFIYDTAKDSVNNSWRSDNTKSWYTEASSVTRCPNGYQASGEEKCTRDFPEIAILVGTDTNLYIYDAESQEIWMRFDQAGGWTPNDVYLIGPNYTLFSTISSLNGKTYLGSWYDWSSASSNSGLFTIDFVNDTSEHIGSWRTEESSYPMNNHSEFNSNIADRNTSSGYQKIDEQDIVNGLINDLHAAVIDGKTYVAVATDGGVSVINETDGTVIDVTDAGRDSDNVALASDGTLYYSNEIATDQDDFYLQRNIHEATVDITLGKADYIYCTFQTHAIAWRNVCLWTGWNRIHINSLEITEWTSIHGWNTLYIGTNEGLSIIQEKAGDENNGSVKYITSEYATEEMVGDIRGMWTFDGSAPLTDNSLKTNNLINNGGVDFSSTGVRGKAAKFDGSNYLSIADSADLDLTDFTLWLWIKRNSNGTNYLISRYEATTVNQWIFEINANNKLHFNADLDLWGGANYFSAVGNKSITDTNWHFLNLTRDWDVIRMYIDGEIDSEFTNQPIGTFNSNLPIYIGQDFRWTGFAAIDGLIDEPFITAEALDAATIKHMYETGKKNLEAQESLNDGLVGYWKMDPSTSSGQATDHSSNGNHGTWSGGASAIAGGKFDGAGSFDGVNDYLRINNNSTLNVGNTMTVNFWINPSEPGWWNPASSNKGIIGKGTPQAFWWSYLSTGYYVGINRNNNRLLFTLDGATAYLSASNLEANVWQNVTFTYDDISLRIYINWILDQSYLVNAGPLDTTNDLTIGQAPYSGERYYEGLLDDVAIYNRALSSAEISRMYASQRSLHDTAFRHRLSGSSDIIRDIATHTVRPQGVDFTVATGDGATQFNRYGNAAHNYSTDGNSSRNTSILTNNINNVEYLNGKTVLGYNITGGIETITRLNDLPQGIYTDNSASDRASPEALIIDDGAHAISQWSNDNTVDYLWSVPGSNWTTYDFRIIAIDTDENQSSLATASTSLSTQIKTYETECNQSATGTTVFSTQTGTTLTCIFQEGASNYLHIRSQDAADNYSAWQHQGPYFIDTQSATGGSITHLNGTQGSLQIAINVNRGEDNLSASGSNSGMSSNDADYLLEVATATVTNEICDQTFTSFQDANITEIANGTNYIYTGLPNTCYKFRYTVKDAAGNSTTYASTRTTHITALDTELPVSKILYPQNNASLTHAELIVGQSTDNTAVAGTRISIYEQATQRFYTGTGFTATQEIWLNTLGGSTSKSTRWYYNSPIWSEWHLYTIRSRALDTAGNEERTDTVSFIYDTVNGEKGSIYVSNPAVVNNANYKVYYPNALALEVNDYIVIDFADEFRFSPWMTDSDIEFTSQSGTITNSSDSINRQSKTITSTITWGSVPVDDMLELAINNLRIHNASQSWSYAVKISLYDELWVLLESGTGQITLVQHYQQVELNVNVEESIQLSVNSGSVLLSVDPDVQFGQNWSGTGWAAMDKSILEVKTNAHNGYNLMISLQGNTQTGSAVLDGTTNTGQIISSISGDRVSTENNFTYTANTGTSSTTTHFTNAPQQISNAWLDKPTNSNLDTIYYYLNVDYQTPADIYRGKVTYTAIGEF